MLQGCNGLDDFARDWFGLPCWHSEPWAYPPKSDRLHSYIIRMSSFQAKVSTAMKLVSRFCRKRKNLRREVGLPAALVVLMTVCLLKWLNDRVFAQMVAT
jgi:hypothetical protein